MAPVELESFPPFPPELFYEEKLFPCGYSPRAMHLEHNEDHTRAVLYVGCKDGSLWRTGWSEAGAENLERIAQSEEVKDSGIRCLFAIGSGILLVGRSNGVLGVLEMREGSEAERYTEIGNEKGWLEKGWLEEGKKDRLDNGNRVSPPRYGGSIRSIGRLDSERIYISFRKLGTLVVEISEPGRGDSGPSATVVRAAIDAAVEEESWLKYRKTTEEDQLRGLRAAVQLVEQKKPAEETEQGSGSWIWLLVDEEGRLFHWSGKAKEPAELLDDRWPRGEHPVLVNDYALVRSPSETKSRGLFLATDLGVHYLELESCSGEDERPELEFVRLSLPGLGPICMALSYVEDKTSPGLRYLWAVDTAGDSHLFCDEREAERPNLRPSGFSHLDSQVMLAIADHKGGPVDEGGILYFAQVRRDDQIVIGSYRSVSHTEVTKSRAGDLLAIRKILSAGSSEEIHRYLREKEEQSGRLAWLGRLGASHGTPGWGAEAELENDYKKAALVSDLVQCVAEDDEIRPALEEFLANPSGTDSARFLNAVVKAGNHFEALKALDLWTTSFLGVIHRYLARDPATGLVSPDRVRRFSLGLLRWLGEVEKNARDATRHPEVQHRLETCVRMVRKWGLFAHEVQRRESLAGPIETLLRGREPSSDDIPAGHQVDLLTHESLLFARGVDLLYEDSRHPMQGRSAWAVDCARLEGADGVASSWMAVAWNWGGIEVFRVSGPVESGARILRLVAVVEPKATESSGPLEPRISVWQPGEGPDRSSIAQEKYGYSRAICLGPSEDRASLHLLCNLAHAREEAAAERLFLFVLPVRDGQLEEVKEKGPSAWVELQGPEVENPSESVYSLLHLGGRQFLAGLRGNAGRAKVQGFRIEGNELVAMGDPIVAPAGLGLEPNEDRQSAAQRSEPELEGPSRPASVQNRVWSLARPWTPELDEGGPAAQEAPEKDHDVLIGCENGQIWRLTWPVDSDLSPALLRERSLARQGGETFRLVARLGSAVEALAYRKDYANEGITARIFAGGEDGAIVAWQERHDPPLDPEELPFAPLWATIEGGPISHLQLWNYECENPEAPPVFVVAICREGTAVLFDDREGPHQDPPRVPPHPRRIQFPGNRQGRLRLGSSVLAAGLWRFAVLDLEKPEPPPFLGSVVTATNDGRIRFLGLDDPRYTPKRRAKYHQLVNRWWKAAWNHPSGPGDDETERAPEFAYQFHLGDAIHGATPFLVLILVRCLLDPRLDRRFDSVPEEIRGEALDAIESHQSYWWQFPRHLRPLVELRRIWDLEASSTEKVGELLELALRLARALGDVILFQEICETVLKRANFHLFHAAGKDDEAYHRRVKELYSRVFEAIEQTLESWRGAPEQGERRVRVVVAKHLVDGDTFLRVLERAAIEEEAAGRGSEKGPFSQIQHKRVVGIRQLMFSRDPIVSLEALRAGNLSLLRLCRRLVVRREQEDPKSSEEWTPGRAPEGSSHEVRWEVFRLYFEQLTFAAAQAFQGGVELSFALAHEFARTFALTVCACPSATIRIANRMTETRLITDLASDQDLCRNVEKQMEILGTIGLTVPRFAREWFHRVTQGPSSKPGGWFPELANLEEGVAEKLFGEAKPDRGKPKAEGKPEVEEKTLAELEKLLASEVGRENAQDILCLFHLRRALHWIERLTHSMTQDATRFDFSEETFKGAKESLEALKSDPVADLYRESYRFWNRAFAALEERNRSSSLFLSCEGGISHRALGVSLVLKDWAHRQRKSLRSAHRKLEIFQPERAVFDGILSRLEIAAGRFARSAAVQKAVVTAVLGHHLLEDLDEHIFELEEIAMVLDPVLVRQFRESGRTRLATSSKGSMAQRFSTYLIHRARRAESLPKNLRMLYGLLESGEVDGQQEEIPVTELLDPYETWQRRDAIPSDWKVTPRVAAHLDLVFEELHQNQVKHSRAKNGEFDTPPLEPPEVGPSVPPPPGEGRSLCLRFPFAPDPDNCRRLEDLRKKSCDRPIDPKLDPEVASSGAGLYLASLAAAVAGWRLSLEVACPPSDGTIGVATAAGEPGILTFTLQEVEKNGREEA